MSVSRGRRTKSSVIEVAKAAKDQRFGAVSGVIRSWRRKSWGREEVMNWGRVWYRVVGSQRLLGGRNVGRRLRLLRTPRWEWWVGVTINFVLTISRGKSRSPLTQLERAISARPRSGEGASVRSRPEVPAAAVFIMPGARIPWSGPPRSGRPKSASRRDRTKESVVRIRIE
jgi:hypothetical protein